MAGSRPALAARSIAERDSRRATSSDRSELEERGVAQLLLPGQGEPLGQGVLEAGQFQGAQDLGQVGPDRVDRPGVGRAVRDCVVVLIGCLLLVAGRGVSCRVRSRRR